MTQGEPIPNRLLVAIGGNAVCFYVFDGEEDPTITFGDAIWYSVVSITTIGYGDYSAGTTGARVGTVLFIVLIGLTAFSLFFGILIDWFTEMALMGERGMAAMGEMVMPFPANTLPMMTGEGQFGPIEMGGMFTVLKIRKDQKTNDYSDPGWYRYPQGTVAYEATI